MSANRTTRTILIAIAFISPLCCASQLGGQTHNSARIYALGGTAVSGIIPDYYTDLMFNPAYASRADAFTINYGHRDVPSYLFPFFHFENDFSLSRPNTTGYDTNELLAYGMRFWGWKVALLSEWYAYKDDDTESVLDTYHSGLDYRNTARAKHWNDERNYVHAALSCSRHVGDDHILGLRFGTFDYYYGYARQYSTYTERYRFSEDHEETYLSDVDKWYDYNERTQRWLSPYVQIGLLMNAESGRSSELIFKISRDDVGARRENFQLEIQNNYDPSTGTRTSHYYTRGDWIDKKDGTMWSFDLWGRHAFANGLRIFAGGGYRTAAYDGGWFNTWRNYEWRSFINDFDSYQAVTGDGDFTEFSFFAKAGKTFRIERRIDVTAGFSTSFTRSVNEEEPMALFTRRTVYDDELEKTSVSGLARFEMERISAKLILPLAVEYKPTGYLTIFAGLTSTVGWTRNTEEYRVPPILSEDMQATFGALRASGTGRGMLEALDGGITGENSDDLFSTAYGATFGFSMKYRDKLFFDLYSGSDLTPDYIANYYFDLRYSF